MKKRIVLAALVAAMIAAGVAYAASSVVYNAVPKKLPPNVPSLGFQATQTNEFGDYVHLGDTGRRLKVITVTMSDWALYSDYAGDDRYNRNRKKWQHPITVNVYSSHLDSNGVPDQLLGTMTQNVAIPWRPPADPSCGTAWEARDGQCYNGLAFNASFDMSGLAVTLPDDVIIGIAYNTQSWGANPIGVDGPYNSLNVGVPANQQVKVGDDDNTDAVFWNTETANNYTDGGVGGVGTFREDTNWTPYGTVALMITAGGRG